MIERLKKILYGKKICVSQYSDDTDYKMRLVAAAVKRQADRDFREVKKQQWKDFLGYWKDFYQASAYLPPQIQDNIERIAAAIGIASNPIEEYLSPSKNTDAKRRSSLKYYHKNKGKKK